MKSSDRLDDLERAMVRAHREREVPELGAMFTQNVMAALHRDAEPARKAAARGANFGERLITRFALGACGAAAACGVYGAISLRGVDAAIAWASFAGRVMLVNNPLSGF